MDSLFAYYNVFGNALPKHVMIDDVVSQQIVSYTRITRIGGITVSNRGKCDLISSL